MAVKSGRKPNNRSRNFSGKPQSLIAEGCRKFSSPITMWCLVSDKTAIPLHEKKPGGIMMRQNYKNEDVCSKLQMKTIDITQRGCVINL